MSQEGIKYRIRSNQKGGKIDIGGRKGRLPVDDEGCFVVPPGVDLSVHARLKSAGHERLTPLSEPESQPKVIETVEKPVDREKQASVAPSIDDAHQVLCAVKGIGAKTADKILVAYPGLQNLADADYLELADTIHGVDEDLAKEIITIAKKKMA